MARFVVLRHDTPDGSWHYDWMIERTDPDADPDRPLLSFRVAILPAEADAFDAERIDDHRAAWLDDQGELTGGRGRVQRVGSGQASIESIGSDLIRVRMGPRFLEGRSDDGRWWRFEAIGPA